MSGNAPGLSPLRALQAIVEGWRWVVVVPLAAGLLTFGLAKLMRPVYAATTTFVPERGSSGALPAGLGALAGQIGISLGGSDAAESPQFYAQLARSRSLLDALLDQQFPAPGGTDSAALISLLALDPAPPAVLRERGFLRLREQTGASVDNQTGVVRLTAEARDPDLAAAMANRIVDLIGAFNLETRQSRARARLGFVRSRLTDIEAELTAAEAALEAFLTRNRGWQSSPELRTTQERLQRDVTLRQEIHLQLSRELETARIEAVNNTPVITVIDPAIAPVREARPRPLRMTAVAMLLGGLLGVALALGARLRRNLAAPDADREAADLRAAWRQALAEMRRFGRRA